MRRREFLGVLGGAVAAWPMGARGQQAALPVLGFSNGQSPSAFGPFVAAFREGLRQIGYVEGQGVAIEYRWADGQESQMPALIDDLVRRPVDVLVIGGSGQGTLAAKGLPSRLPIVVTTGDDPVRQGLVASFNRPGGNITAVMVYTTTLEAKRLDLLHKLLPQAAPIGVIVDPTFPPTNVQVAELKVAAATQGLQIRIFNASSDSELESAFAALGDAGVGAVALVGNPFFNSRRNQIVALSARHAMPSIFEIRQFVEAGGLISYGPSIGEVYRQLGVYAGRILKGEKPGDLPVIQPTKFDLVINLKTAKVLGIEIPPTLIALADEVIE